MPERLTFVPPTKESEDPRIYTKREEEISCNKKDHAERSKANQPDILSNATNRDEAIDSLINYIEHNREFI